MCVETPPLDCKTCGAVPRARLETWDDAPRALGLTDETELEA